MGRDNNKGFYQGGRGSTRFYGDESGGATRTSKWVTQDQVSYAFASAGNPIVGGKARCPLHGDNTPSMSVDVREGRLLVYCHVCGSSRQKDLIEAVRREVSLDARESDVREGAVRAGDTRGELDRVSGVTPRDENGTESNVECPPQIQQIWDSALEIEPGQVTAYCADKNVNAHGLKRLRNGTTLVPMYAAGGLGPLVGIQKILVASDPISGRSKLNVPGSVKDGSALIVGWDSHDLSQLRNAALIVCEGYSTASTVYEVAQGEYSILPDGANVYAVCAFGVGNVLPVAKALKQALSPLSAKILIGVDADPAGMRVAEDAAALGFALCIPDFGDMTERGNDWNDACAVLGAETVAVQIRENLARGIDAAQTPEKGDGSKSGDGSKRGGREEKESGEREEKGRGRRKKKELAGYRDYLDLLRASYPEKEPRLDLVSGDIKVFERGQWQKPDLLILRSTARESDGFYDHTAILDHLSKCAREMTPELLLDVAPVWDGIDRIAVFSDALSTRTFDKKSLRELLEHWLVGVIRKAFDPQEMNHVLVLQGVSGCGKDIWVRRLLRAFTAPWDPTRTVVDGYVTNMNVSGQMDEEDWARFLYKYLVVNISEFDKIKGDARGAAVFKSVTTAEVVAWRPKYEEDVKARPVRASIIASLNPKDINEDSAGARRYIPIELVGHPYSKGAEGAAIDWSYGDTIEKEGEDFYLQLRAQIMLGAQGKRKPLDWATQDSLTEVQEDLTPDDSVNVTIAAVLEDARERLRVGALLEHEEGGREQMEWEGATWEVRRVGNAAFQPIVREHCGLTGESQKKVLNRMGQCRLSWRSKTTRGWKVPFSKV